MSRQNKFRVWDQSKNKYVPSDDFFINGHGELFLYDNFLRKNRIRIIEVIHGFTIEHWTGLKDKNGVGIYEGDILRVANGSINCEIMFDVYSVKWDLCGFALPEFCWKEHGSLECTHWCEVIGNIHEHANLIGGEGE